MRHRRTASRSDDGSKSDSGALTQRLDRWIWHARFLRAREACADLIRSGHVRLNGHRITQPGHGVRTGDVLTLALPGATRVVRVIAFVERRGSPSEASGLFEPVDPVDPGGV